MRDTVGRMRTRVILLTLVVMTVPRAVRVRR